MQKRTLGLFMVILILVEGCIDPLEVAIPQVRLQLVVDGFITNLPGPYTIRLYSARPLETDLERLVPETLAQVSLQDNEGSVEQLQEVEPGVYRTKENGIRGVVGRKYSISIRTKAGKSFYSEPEELMAPGTVDNLSFEFDGGEPNGFRIFADGKGLPSQKDLVRFRTVATYEILTFPHLRTRAVEGGRVPDPFPCSGYIVTISGQLSQTAPCTCCQCWVNQYDDVPVLADERFVDGDLFQSIQVGFVPVNRRTFYNKVRVEVQQMSLTEFTFNYWQLVRAQRLGVSDIFQPPAGKIEGNIRSNDPNEEALGIFWTAGVHTSSLFIEKKDVPVVVRAIDTVKAPCQFQTNSTNQKPEFWR
jgi:hypothetical protein